MQANLENFSPLDRTPPLMCQLIELLDMESSRQYRSSLQRMLVHVGNIRKHVDVPGADKKNIVKRLRDFASTIERVDAYDAQAPGARELRDQLANSLRQAANDLNEAETETGTFTVS